MAVHSGTPDNGFQEVVAIVHDIETVGRSLCEVWGYQVIHQGPADPAAIELLGVSEPAVEMLIGDVEQGRGYLRLIAFPGLKTGLIRNGAHAWDVGGIFDINIRPLVPTEELYLAMTRAGFMAFSPTVRYDFSGLVVDEVVAQSGDGICTAVIEQIEPPLTGFEAVKGPASFIFNSSQTVSSVAEARKLFVDALGWKPVHETEWTHADGKNCIGLPTEVAKKTLIKVGIYQAQGKNLGSVEVIEISQPGEDHSGNGPPNRGLAALRFPMADVEGFLSAAKSGGCHIIEPRTFLMHPYGEVLAGAAVTPWGARLEAYSLIGAR